MKWPECTGFRQRAGNASFSDEIIYRRTVFFHYEQPLAGQISPTSASGELCSGSLGVSGEVHLT